MKKNKLGMILIIVLLVILLILFGVGFTFLYKALMKTNNVNQNTVVVEQELPIEDITNFPIAEPIATNLLEGPDKKEHLLRISVNLGINTSKKEAKNAKKLMPLLEERIPIIRDTIVGVCNNKTYEELSKNGRDILKDEILLKLQEVFSTELIVDVYINDYLIQ